MAVAPGAYLASEQKPARIRYLIVLMLFVASSFSYGDRVMLSIAGIAFSKDLHMDAVRLGYLFSGFSWAYVAGQLPPRGPVDLLWSSRVCGTRLVSSRLSAQLGELFR